MPVEFISKNFMDLDLVTKDLPYKVFYQHIVCKGVISFEDIYVILIGFILCTFLVIDTFMII